MGAVLKATGLTRRQKRAKSCEFQKYVSIFENN